LISEDEFYRCFHREIESRGDKKLMREKNLVIMIQIFCLTRYGGVEKRMMLMRSGELREKKETELRKI
jgi:hypothetical protein